MPYESIVTPGTMILSPSEMRARIEHLEAALRSFCPGGEIAWGKVKAWIVQGAPDQKAGVAAAALITRLQARADDLLASRNLPNLGVKLLENNEKIGDGGLPRHIAVRHEDQR